MFQLFTFLCIAAAVLCGMINYLTAETLNWFWFAGAGCLCTWLIVTVAYRKRRNLLKNEMWQLLLVTAIAVLWDIFTGWRGWSVDFVFPIGALTVLCSVPLIAKVQRLEREEYLFYFIQAAMAGCVPDSSGLDRPGEIYLSVGDLWRNQFPGAGSVVYF